MALVDSFILLYFCPGAIQSGLSLSANNSAPISLIRVSTAPLDLEYAVFFPAVTLAALHTDCLSSSALPSLIQPWNPPALSRPQTHRWDLRSSLTPPPRPTSIGNDKRPCSQTRASTRPAIKATTHSQIRQDGQKLIL